jgi:hypothetical protein
MVGGEQMKRDIKLRIADAFLILLVCLTAAFFGAEARAQTAAGETDVAQSMGVGLKSRFASGATPIQLSRTAIVPGTPMTVRSTMSNIMTSGSSSSFGGILARYDTENFGKFFGTGTLAPRATSSRVDALEDLDQGDNVVENIETERMYPPRLVLDFNQYPIRSLTTTEARSNMSSQIENVIARFDFDRNAEEINVANSGSTVYLRGKVKSARLARLVESVVSLQAGVEEVVNELEILESDAQGVDVFGQPTNF